MVRAVQGNTLNRNLNLHEILRYVTTVKECYIQDIMKYFDMSESRIRAATNDLIAEGFMAKLLEARETGGKRYRFRATDYSLGDLHRKFPVTAKAAKPRVNMSVTRDPLDTYLMGHGPAPSLLFRSSSNAECP